MEYLKLNRITQKQEAQGMYTHHLEEGQGCALAMSLLGLFSLSSFTAWSPDSGDYQYIFHMHFYCI